MDIVRTRSIAADIWFSWLCNLKPLRNASFRLLKNREIGTANQRWYFCMRYQIFGGATYIERWDVSWQPLKMAGMARPRMRNSWWTSTTRRGSKVLSNKQCLSDIPLWKFLEPLCSSRTFVAESRWIRSLKLSFQFLTDCNITYLSKSKANRNQRSDQTQQLRWGCPKWGCV